MNVSKMDVDVHAGRIRAYKVTSKAEQAAIVSLMAFETEDFKYNKNHFPGVDY
jgi:hypothetical protein